MFNLKSKLLTDFEDCPGSGFNLCKLEKKKSESDCSQNHRITE